MNDEEQLHQQRMAGYAALRDAEIRCAVLAEVNAIFRHRLENIRLFADREQPSREEILGLVEEMQRGLSRLCSN